jgi:hypothetical protein
MLEKIWEAIAAFFTLIVVVLVAAAGFVSYCALSVLPLVIGIYVIAYVLALFSGQ